MRRGIPSNLTEQFHCDTLALRQIDTIPDDPNDSRTQGINAIPLPAGARPYWVAAFKASSSKCETGAEYLYVADEQSFDGERRSRCVPLERLHQWPITRSM